MTTAGTAPLAVVGAGWWSSSVHLPAIAADPRAELVAVCDADPARARAAAELFGARRWTSRIGDLVDWGVRGAIVATPHDTHHAVAGPLLDAGVDVLLEKPMAVEPRDAWDLVDRAERGGARLHVGYPFLHSAQGGALRRLVSGGTLGAPVLVEGLFATAVRGFYRGDMSAQSGAPFRSLATTYASAAHGGGQLLTQLTHAAAMALWCLDDAVDRVTGMLAVGPGSEVDDVDAVTASTTSGTVVALASTGTVHDNAARVERYAVFGTGGHVLLDTVTGDLVAVLPDRDPQVLVTASAGEANAVRAPLAALLAGVLDGRPPIVTGVLGARVVELLWAARESARTARAVGPREWRTRPAGTPTSTEPGDR